MYKSAKLIAFYKIRNRFISIDLYIILEIDIKSVTDLVNRRLQIVGRIDCYGSTMDCVCSAARDVTPSDMTAAGNLRTTRQ